jgi:hypothetical protein
LGVDLLLLQPPGVTALDTFGVNGAWVTCCGCCSSSGGVGNCWKLLLTHMPEKLLLMPEQLLLMPEQLLLIQYRV